MITVYHDSVAEEQNAGHYYFKVKSQNQTVLSLICPVVAFLLPENISGKGTVGKFK